MDDQKQQIVERLKQANNILVTVKSNPTIDHLAACLGLTLALNKMGKHATAVFSGEVPSTMEFLQPEKTLEKNTDSLRDFIIALDKSKADKLRYKVEDKVVKIFITPYKTSINERDLNFSQGDFNVDVVLAIGVHQQADLDQAITMHGRILHDATVASVTVDAGPNLGSINWSRATASSLSELATELIDGIDKSLVDGQIATAFLTGIVAETDRFSNNRTSPQTMSISAELMAAGANQQLVATKLAEPAPQPIQPVAAPAAAATPQAPAPAKSNDGELDIEHDEKPVTPQINIDADGSLHLNNELDGLTQNGAPELAPIEPPKTPEPEKPEQKPEEPALPKPHELPKITPEHTEAPHMILQPPTLGGPLSSTSEDSSEFFDPMMDAASGTPPHQPILSREPLGEHPSDGQPPKSDDAGETTKTDEKQNDHPDNPPAPTLPEPVALPAPAEADNGATLSDIEKQLHSPHVTESDNPSTPPEAPVLPDVSSARDAVTQAAAASDALEPVQALNAQPVNLAIHPDAPTNDAPTDDAAAPNDETQSDTAAMEDGPSSFGQTFAPNGAPMASPAPFAPEGLTLPGVTGATDSPVTGVDALPTDAQDPNAPPPVPPPMLPPLPS
ncbi:MAG TPA: hypothetical protein VLG11_03960 [Candidatus Saccharimonadales bacterium]|nr:hypothetical protein [Candidatus Saccharimonadales bacterium]